MTLSIDDLVTQQIERWEQSQALAGEAQRAKGQQRPVITISRCFGARGIALGKMIAERLGFDVYERELVERIAQSAKVRERLVETLDSRLQSRIHDRISSQFASGTFSASDYLEHLSRLVLTIGQHGRAVVVGRGAHHILEPERTLRLRAIADLDSRVRHVAERSHMSPEKARVHVLRVDAERSAYISWHFSVRIDDVSYYDLVLNTGTLGLELCTRLVVEAFEARFGTPKAAARAD